MFWFAFFSAEDRVSPETRANVSSANANILPMFISNSRSTMKISKKSGPTSLFERSEHKENFRDFHFSDFIHLQ